ncbi:MAG: HU family DNA-binding protein [Planctomycetota bacterium]
MVVIRLGDWLTILSSSESLLSPKFILKGIARMAKAAAKKKPATKTEIFNSMVERTGLTKKQVAEFFDALSDEIAANIGKKGPRVFQIPNLCKIVAVDKPALPKRQVRNPATGEMIWAPPKPASVQVKVRPLKKLKEMA